MRPTEVVVANRARQSAAFAAVGTYCADVTRQHDICTVAGTGTSADTGTVKRTVGTWRERRADASRRLRQ